MGNKMILPEEYTPLQSPLRSPFVASRNEEVPELPFRWKVIQCTLYLFGAVAFLYGSTLFYPTIDNEVLGGRLFAIGSAGFFWADMIEFSTYFGGQKHERKVSNYADVEFGGAGAYTEDGRDTRIQSLEFVESTPWYSVTPESIYELIAVIGSFLYLLGCVLFLPRVHSSALGNILFIPGSAMIIIASSLKLRAAGFGDNQDRVLCENPPEATFEWKNLLHDIPSLLGELTAIAGALCFLLGCVLFLSDFDVSTTYTHWATFLFVVGSSIFVANVFILIYTYFIYEPANASS